MFVQLFVKDGALAPPSGKMKLCIERKHVGERVITFHFIFSRWPVNSDHQLRSSCWNPISYIFGGGCQWCHLHAGLSFTPAQWSNSSRAQFTFTTSFQRTTVQKEAETAASPRLRHRRSISSTWRFVADFLSSPLCPSLPHASNKISLIAFFWEPPASRHLLG